jgi:Protein of unknown function (DUF1203)
MSTVKFVSLSTEVARAYQSGAVDANGQKPERHVSDGKGVPCRHCQRDVEAGRPYLILAYRPFPEAQPYAEVGPIFLHADPCERYPVSGDIPAMFLKRERFLIKGYHPNDRIYYGTGEIVASADLAAAASRLLERQDVAYVHVRSALNNCYQCRIDRA